jgi:hypothetical protein
MHVEIHGHTERSRITGATRFDISTILPPASVEIAGLYYASFLYTGKWDHGKGIALVSGGKIVGDPRSVKRAYSSYRSWFKRVKRIGIARAREANLQPLSGTELSWY